MECWSSRPGSVSSSTKPIASTRTRSSRSSTRSRTPSRSSSGRRFWIFWRRPRTGAKTSPTGSKASSSSTADCMDSNLLAVVGLITVALAFDYINGFHDAANSIATVVSTRVLTPAKAVVWAAFFNFVAAFGFGTAVAKTVGAGMVDLSVVTFGVIFAGLMGAIIWDLMTWYFGLPTSSSHALFGGYAGAAVAKAGFGAIILSGWTKTLLFIVVSPLIGLAAGLLIMTGSLRTFRVATPRKVDRFFRRMQLLSAAAFSLMHGANDAQKTMGIIAGALVTGGFLQLENGEL